MGLINKYIYFFKNIVVEDPPKYFNLHKMSEDYLVLMRKNFENQFGKVEMPAIRPQTVEEPSDESDSEYSEFDGLTDDEDDQPIVVKHKKETIINDRMIDKQSKKAFMVSCSMICAMEMFCFKNKQLTVRALLLQSRRRLFMTASLKLKKIVMIWLMIKHCRG